MRLGKKQLKTFRMVSLLIIPFLAVGVYVYASTPNVAINLGTSGNFGLLAGSGITNVSAATTIVGDVGSSPTPSVTGITQSQVTGTLYLNPDPATVQAQTDLIVAYNQAAGAPCNTDLTGMDLGGMTLVPGVYCFSSSAGLTGTLTLDGQGDPMAQWVFQIGSTLITGTDSTVALINGAAQCNIFWQVGSSATIQTNNVFVGNILALTSITLDGGTLDGKALARNGAVTISDQETVSGPPCFCTINVSSSSAGTVTSISWPTGLQPGPSQVSSVTQNVIATGLTSPEGLACGKDKRIYVAESGVFGGPRQIVRMDQSGNNMTTYLDFSKNRSLSTSGGPEGPSFNPKTQKLYFNTTLSAGFSNTGVWTMSTGANQVIMPFNGNGNTNGGGATVFLSKGPYAGNLLAVDQPNNKVVRVPPPFTSAQPGIDFITTLLVMPTGLAVDHSGNIFVGNSDGTIQQFSSSGAYVGLYASTGLHNMNMVFNSQGRTLFVATQEGPFIEIPESSGTQYILGTVVGGNGVADCSH